MDMEELAMNWLLLWLAMYEIIQVTSSVEVDITILLFMWYYVHISVVYVITVSRKTLAVKDFGGSPPMLSSNILSVNNFYPSSFAMQSIQSANVF